MAQITVNRSDTFEDWRVKTNGISAEIGDMSQANLTLGNNLVEITNSLDTNIVNLENRILALTIALG
jgi:hypothetical protein